MLTLTEQEQAQLRGDEGEALRLAMRLIVEIAEVSGAERLIDVSRAHVVGCFYTGTAGLDFAELLVREGARVAIPTTLNTGWLNLSDQGPRAARPYAPDAQRLMELYTRMGCKPTFTCAPYHLPSRPRLGEDIAWAETNAVTFANSLLGARTNRWVDFTEICAAITGKAPYTGLHVPENRRGRIVFELDDLAPELFEHDALYHLLGYVIGQQAGSDVPVIVGMPQDVSEDQLRAICSISALSGAVSLFHAVGVTPEAATLEDALQGGEPDRVVRVSGADLLAARRELTTADDGGRLRAVCLGTPHMSLTELERLSPLLAGRRVHPDLACYVSTSRHVAEQGRERGSLQPIEDAGVTLIVDTCTYYSGYLDDLDGIVMTDSAKWAFYAPPNINVKVSLATMEECAEAAVAGRPVEHEAFWADARWVAAR